MSNKKIYNSILVLMGLFFIDSCKIKSEKSTTKGHLENQNFDDLKNFESKQVAVPEYHLVDAVIVSKKIFTNYMESNYFDIADAILSSNAKLYIVSSDNNEQKEKFKEKLKVKVGQNIEKSLSSTQNMIRIRQEIGRLYMAKIKKMSQYF